MGKRLQLFQVEELSPLTNFLLVSYIGFMNIGYRNCFHIFVKITKTSALECVLSW